MELTSTHRGLALQIIDVVMMAAMVPRGILRLGSRKSPLRFDPAMMPKEKSGSWMFKASLVRTSDGWEVDANKN